MVLVITSIGLSSPSLAVLTRIAASHTSTDASAGDSTTAGPSTVMPPMIACATTPGSMTGASRTSRGRRGREQAEAGDRRDADEVSSRLPNSMAWCSGAISA